MTVTVQLSRTAPKDIDAVAIPVASAGAVPKAVGLSRAALAAAGFEGKPSQTLVLPSAAGPTTIAVGIGDANKVTAKVLRDAAAAAVRAAGARASLATSLADIEGVDGADAGQAVVEGALLATYRFRGRKTEAPEVGHHQPDARRRPEAHRRRQGRRAPRRGDRRSHGARA